MINCYGKHTIMESKITNCNLSKQNFVQISSPCWKVLNCKRTNMYWFVISKSVRRNAAFLCITVDLFHWNVRVLVMSALILYCATSTFRDTRNVLSKMSLFVRWKLPYFVQVSNFHPNFAISFIFFIIFFACATDNVYVMPCSNRRVRCAWIAVRRRCLTKTSTKCSSHCRRRHGSTVCCCPARSPSTPRRWRSLHHRPSANCLSSIHSRMSTNWRWRQILRHLDDFPKLFYSTKCCPHDVANYTRSLNSAATYIADRQ